jgi:hypothetical protein
MNKDTSVRIAKEDWESLSKIAKKEGRTLKMMLKMIIKLWKEEFEID